MKKIRAFICLLLLISLVFSLSACSDRKAASYKISFDSAVQSAENKTENKNLFCQPLEREKLIRVARNDLSVLYFDETTMSFSLYDASGKRLWNCLPEDYCGTSAAVLSVDVFADGKCLTFNSQSDSVEKGLAEYKIEDRRIFVTYSFRETLENGTEISFSVPAVFSFEGQVVSARINCADIDTSLCSDGVFLRSISFLEYFGSCRDAEEGDFILIPEGSGAILDIHSKVDSFEPLNLRVYGEDTSEKGSAGNKTCFVPTFGMKRGESAFVALIQEGDSVATITANKTVGKNSCSRVGTSFCLTPIAADGNSGEYFVGENRYTGNISIAYRFLSGSNTSYCAMAGVCRETLIRNGAFSLAQKEAAAEAYPFILNLIGSAGVGSKGTAKSLTTFEQAADILSILRGKGLGNIILRYSGIFSGSLKQEEASSMTLLPSLGNKNDYKEFLSFIKSQNIKYFADAALVSSSAGISSSPALSLAGSKVTCELTDFSNSVISSKGETEFVSAKAITENTDAIINKFNKYNIPGICLSDAGKFLFSNFSQKNYSDRAFMMDIIRTNTQALSATKNLMVDMGNIYTVKYADYIANLPTSSTLASQEGYSSIPFIQILLRSVTEYSSPAINLASDSEKAILKAAEYGCIPAFTLYYSDLSTEEKADNSYYLNQMSVAQQSYERLSNTLGTLRNKRITDHYKVKKGVWCTEYEGGINVYVNYNSKDVTVNEITLEAKSFLRVG